LDTTFHRDDYRRRESPLLPSAMDVPFGLEGQNVLLVDDVLYTGRTIRAAMDALLSFGRPARVELLVLVDRIRRREVPVEPTYWGMRVDSVASDRVVVNWREMHDEDAVILVSQ
jgi:pyrimidine operon attenuation protein/uracil phosphoribosyltransferase